MEIRSDLDKAEAVLAMLRQNAMRITALAAYKSAHLVGAEVKHRIESQLYHHEPLSPSYKRWKEKNHLDPRILIATGDYVNAIGVYAIRNKKNRFMAFGIGVPPGIHKPSGLTYDQLYRIHEFGVFSRNIPARPHWRPAWKDFLIKKLPIIRREHREQMLKMLQAIKKRQPKLKRKLKAYDLEQMLDHSLRNLLKQLNLPFTIMEEPKKPSDRNKATTRKVVKPGAKAKPKPKKKPKKKIKKKPQRFQKFKKKLSKKLQKVQKAQLRKLKKEVANSSKIWKKTGTTISKKLAKKLKKIVVKKTSGKRKPR